MAITGTGTELDPYLVHDYDEIKTFITDTIVGDTYGKLANNIDCNEYSAGWEWESIQLPNVSGTVRHLDLDSHTIENIYIKDNNSLFLGRGTASQYIEINNGKILNVFGNNIKSIASYCYFNNISLSSQINTVSDGAALNLCKADRLGLYIIFMHGNQKAIFATNAMYLKNIDVYTEVYDITSTSSATGTAFMIFKNTASGGSYTLDSIRVEGKLVPSSTCTNATTIFSNKVITNSVFEVDTTAFDEVLSTEQNVVPSSSTATNTVINASKLSSSHVIPTGYMSASSNTAMRTGSDLRTIGFLVVNVEE